MTEDDLSPLILTARMDDHAFDLFDDLRQRHFPPDRNLLKAHITLFHKLPGNDVPATLQVLSRHCAGHTRIAAVAQGIRFLGRGVAIEVAAPQLSSLRSDMAAAFAATLSLQDKQGFRPHVTVQNKVDPETARALHTSLSADFAPFAFSITGLTLWRYQGGPWEWLGEFEF